MIKKSVVVECLSASLPFRHFTVIILITLSPPSFFNHTEGQDWIMVISDNSTYFPRSVAHICHRVFQTKM